MLDAAGVLTCFATAAGFAGGLAWWLDLASHFRPQYGAILLGLAALAVLQRRPGAALAYAAFLVANAIAVLPTVSGGNPSSTRGGATLRLLAHCCSLLAY